MNQSEIILYKTEDGAVKIDTIFQNETIWLTQRKMAELFDIQRPAITKHLKNIFDSGELDEQAVSSILEHTTAHGAIEGKTQTKETKYYNLDAIIAVGYRVNSKRATQFRIWATAILKEYIIKGFAIDYDKTSEQAQIFFNKVQNKMLWAITGKTAAELIESRSNPELTNMGLTSWQGSIVRKQDVAIAKNYLKADEIKDLNEIVTMYLDYAERQARQRKTVTMEQWSEKLDAFLSFNEHELLTHTGKVKADVAKQLAEQRYEEFDTRRKKKEALAADSEDLKELEEIEKRLLASKDNPRERN